MKRRGGFLLTLASLAVLFYGLELQYRANRPASAKELVTIERQFVAEYGPASLSSLQQPFVLRMALYKARSTERWLLVSCFSLWWVFIVGGVALMSGAGRTIAPAHL